MVDSLDISTHCYSLNDDSNYKQLDLYIPPGANRQTPLLVFIHGGAWRSEDKADHAVLAKGLANRGFPVATTNYRLSICEKPDLPPAVQHPAHIQDTLEAIQYLSKTPPSDRYDPARLFLIGHSAGAHIATSLVLADAFAPARAVVQGVVAADGIYDIPLLLHHFPDYIAFIEQAFGTMSYDAASPVNMVPSLESLETAGGVPPILIVHSLEDELVDLAQSEALLKHLKSLDVYVDLNTKVQGKHHEMVHGADFVNAIVEFVNKVSK